MTGERTERRLAAILAADVAGYSRLMGEDELGTLRALKALRRELIDPCITSFRGRIVKSTGDGLLVEFPSAVDAVTCAVTVQTRMKEQAATDAKSIVFRIGINVGDIIIDGDDIFGDGVNVASRIEAECEPGGVYLSASAFEQVRGKTDHSFDDLGDRKLKNIERPVRLYAASPGQAPVGIASPPAPTKQQAPNSLSLPDKPSIAVLPFQNMSGDPEQEYFADGMVEEIITAISRFKHLFVIARNSSFTYKGRAVDVKQVGRELGVRYVLEGSVRKAGNRIRITAQLIDSSTGAHLWADRFDEPMEDVFALQDRVTANVIGQLFAQMQTEEEDRAFRKPTASLSAYDFFLRGQSKIWRFTKESSEDALKELNKAIEIDDQFAIAHASIASVYVLRKQNGWLTDESSEEEQALFHARRALELGQDDATILTVAGFALAYLAREVELGADCIARSLALNQNFSWSWLFSGWLQCSLGQPQKALEHLAQAERLSPRDPFLAMQCRMAAALAHFVAGNYDQSIKLAEALTSLAPRLPAPWRLKAAGYALLDDLDRAAEAGRKVLEIEPTTRVSSLMATFRLVPNDRERYRRGLLRAGLPE